MSLPIDLLTELRRLGVGIIRVEYSGSDDSGCIDSITCLSATDEQITLPDTKIPYTLIEHDYDIETARTHTSIKILEMTLHDAVEQYCYDQLEQHFSGWENDGGADGEFQFDITAGTGTLEHNARYIECCTYEREV